MAVTTRAISGLPAPQKPARCGRQKSRPGRPYVPAPCKNTPPVSAPPLPSSRSRSKWSAAGSWRSPTRSTPISSAQRSAPTSTNATISPSGWPSGRPAGHAVHRRDAVVGGRFSRHGGARPHCWSPRRDHRV